MFKVNERLRSSDSILIGPASPGATHLEKQKLDLFLIVHQPLEIEELLVKSGTLSYEICHRLLKLGYGKPPALFFLHADLNEAITGAISGIFAASGQTCIAGSCLLVQRSIYDKVVDGLIQKSKSIKLGNQLTEKGLCGKY